MHIEEIQDLIREQTRQSIRENINSTNEERIDEMFGLAGLAGLSALGYGWFRYRKAIEKSTKSQAFVDFLKEYDTSNLVYKRVPDIVRRFQLVKSLTDLETMEKRTEVLIGELEQLESRVDEFVSNQDRLGNRIRDQVAGLSGSRLRREVKSHISDIILATRKGFEQEIENKKDELLGEI